MNPEKPSYYEKMTTKLSFAGPLAPVFAFYLLGLTILLGFRLAFALVHFPLVRSEEHWLWIFPIGLRMDTILLFIVLSPIIIVLLALPQSIVRKGRWPLSILFGGLTGILVFMEGATVPYLAEFYTRPDRLFLEQFGFSKEISSMVIAGFLPETTIGILVTLLSVYIGWRLTFGLIENFRSYPPLKRGFIFLVVVPVLVLGIRSGTGPRPANISTAAFSSNHLVNQLGLNSTYSAAYAYYTMKKHEINRGDIYGKMDEEEILSRVRQAAFLNGFNFPEAASPLLHLQKPPEARNLPYNLVILLEESLGAEFVGSLGGLPLTPELEKLSGEGLWMTQLYSTGTRTVRGIEGVVSSFLPTSNKSVVKLGLSQNNFFTLADLLNRKGYITEFVYGGESHFDNMRSFFLGNGFQKIYDEPSFKNPVFRGSWGVSDEDLVHKANEIFLSHGEDPFFALILSTSNHDPFEFPDGRIDLHGGEKMTRNNAVRYSDFAIGKFFKLAKKEPYFKNTVFLVIADHGTRLGGQDLIPIHKFHIPGLFIGPGIDPGKYNKVVSQIDMIPTLLDMIGIETDHPSIGHSILRLPKDYPGRAIMQYGTTHAYMLGDHVMIHRPQKDPSEYIYQDGKLIPIEMNPLFEKEALAHALLPGYLYFKQAYTLP